MHNAAVSSNWLAAAAAAAGGICLQPYAEMTCVAGGCGRHGRCYSWEGVVQTLSSFLDIGPSRLAVPVEGMQSSLLFAIPEAKSSFLIWGVITGEEFLCIMPEVVLITKSDFSCITATMGVLESPFPTDWSLATGEGMLI